MNTTGFLTQEEAERRERERQESASVKYPAVEVGDHMLHVFLEDGEWHVWLNTPVMEFDGLCLSVGKTRDDAVGKAVAALEALTETLQGPETPGDQP